MKSIKYLAALWVFFFAGLMTGAGPIHSFLATALFIGPAACELLIFLSYKEFEEADYE